MAADSLGAALLRLPPSWHGFWFDTVDSTQDAARAAAGRGAADRSLFVADYQRAGRGRQGRTWFAEPGAALLMSILFREISRESDIKPWRFTSLAALSVVEAIQPLLASGAVAIKWPNDVMLDDRKVAGILAETRWDGRELQAIVGIGLNVTASPEMVDATTLAKHTDGPIDRGDVLLRVIQRLEYWLGQPDRTLHHAWQVHLWRRGQRLRLHDLGHEEEVVVLSVDPDGTLEVLRADGTRLRTSTGELLA
ncbi:MAG: biotin--[acetyl-CoA-carboxylase] ligase [Chloroflexi bacterium]|nr:biotin--[acetyl-CoA-carboxylase] ligase [Chloroflexota bacterium]MBV9899097.1 biotin--[acetyl-CoA-carboxylase] ligase [Chloroflexota bacterium]